MRRWTKVIAVAFACAPCFGALADEPPQVRPLDDARLETLRAGLASPVAVLHQVGVILWDEPRKISPPLRSESKSASAIGTANTTTVVNRQGGSHVR